MAVWSLLAAILVLQLGHGNASVVDYESIVMEDACDVLPRSIVIASSGRGSALLIKSHQSDAYKSGLTCTLTVKTKSGYRLLVVFEKLSFPNCSDTVQFGSVQNDPGPICKSMPDPLKSTSNTLNITFTTGGAPKSSDQGFEAVVTAFKDGGYCSLGQHKCLSDTKCIADNFVCDGHNNCGDRSDEICDRSISWSRNLGPLVFVLPMMVMIALCIATPFIMRSCSKSDGQIENDRVSNAAPLPSQDSSEDGEMIPEALEPEHHRRREGREKLQLMSKSYRYIHLPPCGRVHDSCQSSPIYHVYTPEGDIERSLSTYPVTAVKMEGAEDDSMNNGILEVCCHLELNPYPSVRPGSH